MFQDDFNGMEICFLLDIDYLGMLYRFSTIPIDLEDLSELSTVKYSGGLDDPDISQSTSFVGSEIESDSVSLELVFLNLDWVKEWLGGRSLAFSQVRLFCVPILEKQTSYTIQDRIELFSGKVTDPIYGDPTKPKGWISFSIQNDLNVQSVKLLDGSNEITRNRFPIPVTDGVYGKYAPFILGKPGIIIQAGSSKSIEFVNKYPTTPAYRVHWVRTLGPYQEDIRFLIANHNVKASIGRIYDPKGGSFRNPILQDVDDEGNIYSYINIRYPGPVVLEYDNFQQLAVDAAGNLVELWNEYYASWGEEDGGFYQDFLSGALTKGGDICLYVLDKLKLEYDYDAWVGLLPILNRYEFSGFMDDYEVTALDWLRENIISYLPIEVVNSAGGITPNLNLYFYSQTPETQYTITENGQFEIITGIQPLDQPIVNHLTIKFCYSLAYDSYQSTIIVDPRITEEQALIVNDPVASLSFQRFGLREEVLELPFVWDLKTAFRIARDKIRVRGLGAKAIEVSATPRYSYLGIGDIISLSSDIGLENHKCQIIGKSWDDNRWRFVLHIEENPIINPRGL
jgi:hypothetical protein